MLSDLITQIPDWKTKSSQQIFDVLTTPSIEFVDSTQWTWAGIAAVAGNAGAEGLRLALEQGGMGWAVHQLGGSGLVLSLEPIQDALRMLAANGVPGMGQIADATKRLISIAEQNGLNVSLYDVDAALMALQLQARRSELITNGATRWNAFCAAVDSWDGVAAEPEL
ncbi:MAG: hypothetical protein ACK5S6_05110 [bacterium]|jgi:hypothetical protein